MPTPSPTSTGTRVLVLDADQPSALAIVRSLGRRGLAVHTAGHAASGLASHSRYSRQGLVYPDPMHDEAGFIDWCVRTCEGGHYGLVIPVTERSVVPLHRHRDRMGATPVAIAPAAALEQVLDKARTFALAASLGVPVPRSLPVASADEAVRAAQALGYPVVVKPTRSLGQHGGTRVALSVAYAMDERQLVAMVTHALRHGEVVLQEFFRGDGVGVELIADHGVIRYAFQHRRLHEVPLTGGGSSLRVSEPVTPALGRAAEALMAALGWHGVAMVEFKLAADGRDFRLMEINGRFWGSLPLAVAAGADFPAMLHALVTQGKIGDVSPARPGVLCRNLARDLDWVEHVLRRAAPPGLVPLPTMGTVLRDSARVFSPRHHFDVQCLDDMRPGWVDLRRLLARLWQRVTERASLRRRLSAAQRAARLRREALQRSQPAGEVLFLCYGNINRSALAHCHAQARRPGAPRFRSAGFHAETGRPADPAMVTVAARAGLDLGAWRSQAVSADMVRSADLILAMELAHVERLAAEHPASRGKTFLLGAPTAQGLEEAEIPDPYGGPPELYERVGRRVMAAVDAWFGPGSSTTAVPR